MANRPLSPHLQVYRLPLLPTISILTRISAVALSFGLVVLALWLVALGLGEEAYALMTGLLTSPLGLIALIGWTFALMWHSANGVRHLFWDAGRGLDLVTAERTGWAVVAFSIIATLLVWALIWARATGGAA